MSASSVLDGVRRPYDWEWRSLWSTFSRIQESGKPELPPLSVYLGHGVVPRDSREDNHNQLGEDLSRYLVVRRGDLVFNKLRTWQGGLGRSNYEGIVSPAYFVCRPAAGVDSRFVHYQLISATYLAELKRISKWMPPSQFDTPWEMLKRLPLLLPPSEEQRRIADFLDAETARIDRLAELRAAALERLAEHEAAELDATLDELGDKFGSAPLRRFLLGVDQGSSPQCDAIPAEDNEWGVLKVSCLRPGRFNPRENKRLPEIGAASVTHEVREGDLLITRANTPQLVGSTAVVPRVRRGLLLSDKVFRVHLDDRFSPEFVAIVARGRRIRDICAAVSNGASQSMANIRFEEVKSWPLPLADLATQADVVARVTKQTRWIDSIRQRIERQCDLLAERRQALITAAVTGEFDVSAASGRGIEE